MQSEPTEERRKEIIQALEKIEEEANQRGWDRPAELWVIYEIGDQLGCEYIDVFAQVDGHPAEILEEMYQIGVRFDPSIVRALVVISEGYRHRTIEEVRQDPVDDEDRIFIEMFDSVLDRVSKNVGEEMAKKMARHIQEEIQLQMPGPSKAPPEKRREERFVIAVLQDGVSFTLNRTRETDQVYSTGPWMDPQATRAGRISCAMLQLLSWDDVQQLSRGELRDLFRRGPSSVAAD